MSELYAPKAPTTTVTDRVGTGVALPNPDPASTCLITGASSGIGVEFARQLAARGHGVFLVARREDRLRELAEEIAREHGVLAEFAACDLEDAAQCAALPAKVAEQGLAVEVLVNNAGFSTVGDVHANPDQQLGMIRVNCEALVALTSAFLPAMTKRGSGAVINVASMAAFQPIPSQAVYAATKAFVLSFSESVHSEVKKTGVTVTALCPGPVATEFIEAAGFKKGKEQLGPDFVWSSAEDVAKTGIEAAEKGKRVAIPGTANRAIAVATQHTPRAVLLRTVAPAWRRIIGE
jgi:short-subunit dehydrogenase